VAWPWEDSGTTPGLWSDGYRDADAARREVTKWTNAVADKRGWTSAQRATVLGLVETAYASADDASWYGADVRTFWVTLGAGVQRPELRTIPEWGKYADVVRQALDVVDAEAAFRFDTSWYGSVAGGAKAAASAVADKAAEAGNVALDIGKQASNPWWVWGIAVAVVGVAVIQSGALRRR